MLLILLEGRAEGKKALLFLRKKKQKNSCLLGVGAAERDTPRLSDRGGSLDCFASLAMTGFVGSSGATARRSKSFLVLFFKKELLALMGVGNDGHRFAHPSYGRGG
jgi:hypothetical protein